MDIETEVQELATKLQDLDSTLLSVVAVVLTQILGELWSDETEANKFHRHIQEGEASKAAEMIRDKDDAEEISRNLRKLNREIEMSEFEDEEEAKSRFFGLLE